MPSNADIAVTIARDTFGGDAVRRVLISCGDRFAGALASGVLQNGAPLLLVPSTGPVPPNVAEQISRFGASEAIVLGGNAAVTDDIARSANRRLALYTSAELAIVTGRHRVASEGLRA